MKIAIASALDDEYTMPTEVMLESLLESALEETEYYIYLLVPGGYDQKNRERLTSLNRKFPGHHVMFIDMNHRFKEERLTISHVTYPTYYRLLLPDILAEWDKCIYLDGDVLVLEDLGDLYQNNIFDYYVGGVKAPFYCRTYETKEQNRKRLNLPDMDCYINAGVLLMNLRKLREEQMIPRFLSMLEREKEKTNDQDIINVQCYGKIKSLPFCYNYQVEASYLDKNTLFDIFSPLEGEFMNDKPKILHYSNNNVKPWRSLDYEYSDLWWEYFCKTSYAGEEKKRKAIINAKRAEKEKRFEQLIEKLKQEKYVVLFGYYEIGIELLKKLKRDQVQVHCFCDNDRGKWGNGTDGLAVESLENCLLKYPEAFFIITSQNYAGEIARQLEEAGVSEDRILKYRREHDWLNEARKRKIRELYL